MKKLALALALASLLAPASTHAQNAYITNEGSNTVSVIDTATNPVSTTIPVGRDPEGVAEDGRSASDSGKPCARRAAALPLSLEPLEAS